MHLKVPGCRDAKPRRRQNSFSPFFFCNQKDAVTHAARQAALKGFNRQAKWGMSQGARALRHAPRGACAAGAFTAG
jgi:hypothetical protein